MGAARPCLLSHDAVRTTAVTPRYALLQAPCPLGLWPARRLLLRRAAGIRPTSSASLASEPCRAQLTSLSADRLVLHGCMQHTTAAAQRAGASRSERSTRHHPPCLVTSCQAAPTYACSRRDDPNTALLRQSLQHCGVDLSHAKEIAGPCGTALILLQAGGENRCAADAAAGGAALSLRCGWLGSCAVCEQ